MHRFRLATAGIGLASTLLVAGCAKDAAVPEPPSDGGDVMGHVHGLGVDPADNTLYIATHFGLFHLEESGRTSRVADRWQDTMAFAVVGPGHFLGSGHPDLREDLPPHLGLIESTDAGQTWTPLGQQGKADFHILEPAGDVLYAYDATTSRLLSSRDRVTFDEVVKAQLLNVAVIPNDPGRLVATTAQGDLVAIDAEAGETRALGGPTTVLLDTAPDGALIGIDPVGVVRRSADAGESWQELGTLSGAPAAFTATGQGWYAATDDGVFRSDDDGATWSRLL